MTRTKLCPPAWLIGLLLIVAVSTVHAQSARPDADLAKTLDAPFAAFRGGAIITPVFSADLGLDATFPRLRLGRSWATRVDLDVSARFNSRSFGSRRDAAAAVMICQVYTPGGVNRGRYFTGAGIGQVFGHRTGLGAKIFGGINITPVASLELEGQLFPSETGRLLVMVRFSVL